MTKGSFLAISAILNYTSFRISVYLLKYLVILDSRTTLYIFNEISCFNNFRTVLLGDFVFIGSNKVLIQGYREVDIQVESTNEET